MKGVLLLLVVLAGTSVAAGPMKPAACGVRHTLWIDHYSAQLYVPAEASIGAVKDPGQPKMLRMRVLDTALMPAEIPGRWREALQAVLDREAMERLQHEYGGLRRGDSVVLTYWPGHGVVLRINERTVATAPGHAAIDALLAAWAEDGPVEAKLAGTASRNRCA